MNQVHEVWFNPGWDNEQRAYRGDDPRGAATAFSATVNRLGNPGAPDEVVWTIDGHTHQVWRDGRVTHGSTRLTR